MNNPIPLDLAQRVFDTYNWTQRSSFSEYMQVALAAHLPEIAACHYREVSGLNVGHGHVAKRPDGVVARCGGPRICPECALDLARQQGRRDDRPIDHTAAIAEAAREYRDIVGRLADDASSAAYDAADDAQDHLFAAVDAEREAQPDTHPNPKP